MIVKDSGDDSKDRLVWKWLKGSATSRDDFADPTASAAYSLCPVTAQVLNTETGVCWG